MPRLRQQVRAFRLLPLCDGMIATRFAQDLQLLFKISNTCLGRQQMARLHADGRRLRASCLRCTALAGKRFARCQSEMHHLKLRL